MVCISVHCVLYYMTHIWLCLLNKTMNMTAIDNNETCFVHWMHHKVCITSMERDGN